MTIWLPWVQEVWASSFALAISVFRNNDMQVVHREMHAHGHLIKELFGMVMMEEHAYLAVGN